MVMPARPSSSGTPGTDRELRRQPPKPLAPTPPNASKKPSAPRPSSAVARPPAPPSRSVGSLSSAAVPVGATPRLKPGTAVLVRTRIEKMVAGKAVVFWLPAVVVSSTEDGGYEVVYEGKLPRWDPFATVHVQRDHVRPQKPSPPPPSLLPSSAASPCASATATMPAVSKNLEMQPGLMRLELPRPDTS